MVVKLNYEENLIIFVPVTSTQSHAADRRWTHPNTGTYKLNVHAAISLTIDKMGVGAIIRDSQGQVMAALSKPIMG